jgi:hypothetical protein
LDDASEIPDHFADNIINGHRFNGLPCPMRIGGIILRHDGGPPYRLGESHPTRRIRFGYDHYTFDVRPDSLDIVSRICEILCEIVRTRLHITVSTIGDRPSATKRVAAKASQVFAISYLVDERPLAQSAPLRQHAAISLVPIGRSYPSDHNN